MATTSSLAQHAEVATSALKDQLASMGHVAQWLLIPMGFLLVAMVVLYVVGRTGAFRVVDNSVPPDPNPPVPPTPADPAVTPPPAPPAAGGTPPPAPANPMEAYTGTRYVLTPRGYFARFYYVVLLYWFEVGLLLEVGLNALRFFEVGFDNAGTWTTLIFLIGGLINGLLAYGDANPDMADEYEIVEKGPDGKECTKLVRDYHSARRGLARPHPNGEVLGKHLGDYSFSYLKGIHPNLGVGGVMPYFHPMEHLEHHMALGDAKARGAKIEDGKVVETEHIIPPSRSEAQPWETTIGAHTPLPLPPLAVMNRSRDHVVLDLEPQYWIANAVRARYRTDAGALRQLLTNRATSAAAEVVLDLSTDDMVEGEGGERRPREAVRQHLVTELNARLQDLGYYGVGMSVSIQSYSIPAAITQRAQERSARAKSRGMERLVHDLGVDPNVALTALTSEVVATSGKIGTVVAVTGLADIVGGGAARFLGGGGFVPPEREPRGSRGGDASSTGEGPSRETIIANAPPDGPGDAAGAEPTGTEPAAPTSGEAVGDDIAALLDPSLLGSLGADSEPSAEEAAETEE